jgi:hypothetical protein
MISHFQDYGWVRLKRVEDKMTEYADGAQVGIDIFKVNRTKNPRVGYDVDPQKDWIVYDLQGDVVGDFREDSLVSKSDPTTHVTDVRNLRKAASAESFVADNYLTQLKKIEKYPVGF